MTTPTHRDRIAVALEAAIQSFDPERTEDAELAGHLTDAVLAVLPEPTDRAAAELASLTMNAGHALLDEKRHFEIACEENAHLRDSVEAYRLALSTVLGLGTGAPWDAIHDQARELAEAGDRAAAERLVRVHEWVTSEAVTAKTEFGDGYRAAQRDIRDLIRGRFDDDAVNELRRLAAEAPTTTTTKPRAVEAVPCMRSEPHPAHLHSGLRKGIAVHGRCPGAPAAGVGQDGEE